MHFSDTERLMGLGLAVLAALTMALAAAVLMWHSWSTMRDSRVARDSHLLALEFTRFLTGAIGVELLRAAAARAPSAVFWAALETFADNVAGEEWGRLSAALRGLDHAARERDRLARGRDWTRALAARHLGMLDDPANLEPLRLAIAAGPSTVTLTAALALARMHDDGALVWLLDHPDALARLSRHQLVALMRSFGTGAIPAVRLGLASADFERASGLAAVEALGVWQDAESRRPLEALMKCGNLEARVAAARALGAIGATESDDALCAALRDPAWQVRAQAARALGGLASGKAIESLAACMKDVSWWVRRNAAYALGSLGMAGRARLDSVAAHSDDAFARDAAAEVLQALEWDRESPGGVSRVG